MAFKFSISSRCFNRRSMWFPLTCLILLYPMYFIALKLFIPLTDTTAIENLDVEFQVIENDIQNSSSCIKSFVHPWDVRVKPFFKRQSKLECGVLQPFLLELHDNGTLQWNYTELRLQEINVNTISCSYSFFKRSSQNDDELQYSQFLPFTGSLQMTDEFLTIICTYSIFFYTKYYYSNIYFWIPSNKLPSIFEDYSTSREYPSINIILLDSLSQANFIRQLPTTFHTLVNTLNANVLKNLVSVSLSTITNLIALLMGIRPYLNEVGLPNCTEDYFDKCPFIWKNFSNVGYFTGYAEDVRPAGTFNYLKKGFLKQPTDFYLRPFWLEYKNSPLRKRSKNMCFGNVPNYAFPFAWMSKIQNVAHSHQKPYFLVTILNEFSHDYFNRPQVIDEALSKLLLEQHTGKQNNTITIIMGDHGFRFGDYSMTVLGRREKVMPFFAISIPQWLRSKYPHLTDALKINEGRLTTFYDIYDAMMDIIKKRWKKPRKQWSPYGHSIWYPIPENRTCNDAGIPMELCPCNQEVSVPTNAPEVAHASLVLISRINQIIAPHSECEPLQIKQVLTAKRVSSYAKEVLTDSRYATYVLRIIVETAPSNAIFEAMLTAEVEQEYYFEEVNYQRIKSGFRLMKDIYRINRYNDQGHCVEDANLRNYCYCKIQLHK